MPESILDKRNTWRQDNFWRLMATITPAVAGLAILLGANRFETMASTLLLVVWIELAYQEGPPSGEDNIYGFLRTLRVRLYFAGLGFYFVLIWVIFAYSVAAAVVTAFLLYFVLYPIRAGILRIMFEKIVKSDRDLIHPRNKREETDFNETYLKAGGSVIYLTNSVFWVLVLLGLQQYVFNIGLTIYSQNLLLLLVATVAALYFSYLGVSRAYLREKESREHARALADSLWKRKWDLSFEKKRRRR